MLTRRPARRPPAWPALAAGLMLAAGCSPRGASRGLEPQTEDYAQARSAFHTRLVRQGPAPQRDGGLAAPPGAVAIPYNSGGLRLTAWVSPAPPDGQKHPAVLFLHGGFALGADDWDQTRPYRDAGYVVLEPALRGENGQPGSYSMFFDETDDALGAAAALAELPYVDSGHLYVAGHSVGGTLSLLVALTSNRFKAAASFSGSPDQVAWARGQSELVPFDPGDIREFRIRSPIAYASSFKCPVRLSYGSQEWFFSDSCQHTAKLAREKGLDVEAVSVPGDHFTAVPAELQKSIEFFREHQ